MGNTVQAFAVYFPERFQENDSVLSAISNRVATPPVAGTTSLRTLAVSYYTEGFKGFGKAGMSPMRCRRWRVRE
ncbi:MAG: hypothetical protein R3F37_20640 [Candidatus Competibacteraceae bacterium]